MLLCSMPSPVYKANPCNPILIRIPCHRLIGYAGRI